VAAVGLMADDDDRLSAPGRCGAHVVRRRAGREPLVDLRLAETERGSGLARPEQRARDDRVGREAVAPQALAEGASVLAALRRQLPQLVGVAGSCLCVPDDEEAHRRENDSLALVAGHRYVVTDVFTDVPLTGNQLAVFTDARDIPEEQLQKLAREMNYSETTFVYPPETDGNVKVRIFTPDRELPFAGHPILGTAFVLAGPLQLEEIRLETGNGVVPVRLEREGARIVFGWMQQPHVVSEPFERVDELLAVLGAEQTGLPIELYRQGPGHVLVELPSAGELAALRPDVGALARLMHEGAACFAHDGRRWKLRVFVPAYGVDEDPATGSAAGPLALHLARHERIAFGEEIEISQGVEIGRPSTLYAVAQSPEQVDVGGSAVIVARGEFRI